MLRISIFLNKIFAALHNCCKRIRNCISEVLYLIKSRLDHEVVELVVVFLLLIIDYFLHKYITPW